LAAARFLVAAPRCWLTLGPALPTFTASGGRNPGQFQIDFSVIKIDPGDPDGDSSTQLENLPRALTNQTLLRLIKMIIVPG
jgi:hypothetical protein